MLLILFAVAVVGLAWIILKPAWLPRPPENQVTTKITTSAAKVATTTKTVTGSVAGTTGSWFNRLKARFQKPPELGLQLIAWASEANLPGQTGLAAWLGGLTGEQANQLASQLAAFCRSQGLELSWLFDVKTDIAVKAALDEIVASYSQAVWKGQRVQPLAAFQRWQAAPTRSENSAFTRQLYTRLVAVGLISVPSELFLAKAKEREAHVIQAIQSAAVENREVVLAQVAELFATEGVAKTEKKRSSRKAKKQAAPAEVPSEIAQEVVA